MGKRKPVTVVFHKNGKHLHESTLARHFGKLLKKSGLHKIQIKGTRHTCATLLLTSGVSVVAYVREHLGHASIKTTVDIYGHWIPGSGQKFANILD
ncbi:Integrase catalytic domain-containing protein [Desulfonema magnum]|uniref:Integrase catalytic domain-containing protein n=2 Tax=Desulfonema magnum TaxID=45655 RepID=A0A975BH17_9BACT|nr:tyrosine-type recombinase/integrase [Desulfonema magnum]QTA85158.1 Integrase catalytic domain-containing protein [Desulfonema magnum]